MLAYPDALAIVLAQRRDWGTQRVGLAEAAGRVLAEPIVADRDLPPFDRVAMDGFAIDHAAYAAGHRHFRVAGIQAAGEPASPLPAPDTCLEVMTGAALPRGANTVVRYERLRREGDVVEVTAEVRAGADVHPRAADAAAGDELAARGRRIGLAEVGLLASCGFAEVRVQRLPRIAIAATGTELVSADSAVEPHQIRASNLAQLAYLLAGAAPEQHLLRDDPAVLRERLGDLLARCELLVLSGGVSRGRYDYVPEVLAELGVERLFQGVAQRPGKPLWVGRTDRALVVGLPGNPLAAVACAVAYLGPWLRTTRGLDAAPPHVPLAVAVPPRGDLTLLQSVALDPAGRATPVRYNGSGDLTGLLRADGLAILPGGRPDGYRAGEAYPYLPFQPLI